MALVVADRVRETTTTTGTGTVTLAGAVTGYQSFSVIGNGNTTYYTIANGAEWEVGIGTYTSSGTTLSRDTVLGSSNGGSLVNFSAGAKQVFVTYPAGKSVYRDASGNVSLSGSISATNIATGAALISDTDTTLAANSDSRVATQKATKTYVDNSTACAWVFISSWTYSTNVPGVDFTNLGSYSELMVVCNDITKSTSSEIALRVSTDNGSSFFSGSSDYQTIVASGITATGQFLGLHQTPTSLARSAIAQILCSNINGQFKTVVRVNRTDGIACRFIGSTSPINAIRIFPSAGGNFTAGNIQLFGRR